MRNSGGMYEPKVFKPVHEALADAILADPTLKRRDLAKMLDRSETWVTIIQGCDAYKEYFARRKQEIVDPVLIGMVEERFTLDERVDGAAKTAMDKLISRLDSGEKLKTHELVSIAKLGVGENKPGNVQNNLYVVALPQPAASTNDWLSSAQGRRQAVEVIEPLPPGV